MLPKVFLYQQPEIDHVWMSSCPGFNDLEWSVTGEKLAEVELRKRMATHPSRVWTAHEATVFYIPVFEFVSWKLDRIRNCTRGPVALLGSHRLRMTAAAASLRKSVYWQRCFGCDHIFASSATDSPMTRISMRMKPLSDLLICSTAGRYKVRVGGGCQTEIPYRANPYGIREYNTHRIRPLLVSFSGALDVCCSGQKTRCAIGDVLVASHTDDSVSMLISVRNGDIGNNTCASRTLSTLERVTNVTYAANLRRQWKQSLASAFQSTLTQRMLSQRAGDTMSNSTFCLIPYRAHFKHRTDTLYTFHSQPIPYLGIARAIRTFLRVCILQSGLGAFRLF